MLSYMLDGSNYISAYTSSAIPLHLIYDYVDLHRLNIIKAFDE